MGLIKLHVQPLQLQGQPSKSLASYPPLLQKAIKVEKRRAYVSSTFPMLKNQKHWTTATNPLLVHATLKSMSSPSSQLYGLYILSKNKNTNELSGQKEKWKEAKIFLSCTCYPEKPQGVLSWKDYPPSSAPYFFPLKTKGPGKKPSECGPSNTLEPPRACTWVWL